MLNAYIPLVKAVTQVAAGMGVSKIVTDIVQNNVSIATPVQAATVKIGSFVLGSMLWEQSSQHIERQSEQLIGMIKKHTANNTTSE